jgi:hypothetical protein
MLVTINSNSLFHFISGIPLPFGPIIRPFPLFVVHRFGWDMIVIHFQ